MRSSVLISVLFWGLLAGAALADEKPENQLRKELEVIELQVLERALALDEIQRVWEAKRAEMESQGIELDHDFMDILP